jgi:RNA polymerase sigma-70 factor, ECF subfamily
MSRTQHFVDIENIDGLYSYALVLTRNPVEAKDLVQETYVRALGTIEFLRAAPNIRGWMFTILRNIWLNQMRRWSHSLSSVSMDDDESVADGISEPTKGLDEFYVDREPHQQVRDAISQLPIEFGEIVLLCEYENLSYREIAKVLDCSLGTVASRLGRARLRLRTILGQKSSKIQEKAPS